MIVLLIPCFIILFCLNDAKLEIKDTLKKRNLEFVENLKQDLRRNNDYYIDTQRSTPPIINNTQEPVNTSNLDAVRYKIISTRENKKMTKTNSKISMNIPTMIKVTIKEKEDVRYKIIDNIRRRVNNALKSKESMNIIDDNNQDRRAAVISTPDGVSNIIGITPPTNTSTIKSLWSDMQKIIQVKPQPNLKVIKFPPNKNNQLFRLNTLTTAANSISEKVKQKQRKEKKSRMEKFKKFIEKNKVLLREFISSKKQMTQNHATYATPYHGATPQLELISQHKPNKVMRQATSALNNLGELPDADLLDMAPAKGARIQDKRQNRRLCHRHVLIPEGPKYDSAGRVYLAAHVASRGAGAYNATRPPRLLLPRCCNCCRKSVLGCE